MPGEATAQRDAYHRAGKRHSGGGTARGRKLLPKRCSSLRYNPAISRLERGYTATFECGASRPLCVIPEADVTFGTGLLTADYVEGNQRTAKN